MERIKFGVPVSVRLMAYLFHCIIAAIALIVYVLLFVFLGAGATKACAELKRINDAPHSEIIYSNAKNGEDSFYYLKQHHIKGAKNTSISCDIFMVEKETEYKNNDIYFSGTLEAGTCAVSENLAREYGVKIGGSVEFIGLNKSLKVVRFLTAQSGIDKEYFREGVAVVAFDEEFLNSKPSFVSFATDGDEYPSLISLVFIKDWKHDNAVTLTVAAVVAVAAFVAVAAVCEYFLFKRRRRDYKVMAELGKRGVNTFLTVWLENLFKYLAPFVIAALCFIPSLSGFGAMYALPVAVTACIYFAGITAYSFFFTRRLYLCHPKIKR